MICPTVNTLKIEMKCFLVILQSCAAIITILEYFITRLKKEKSGEWSIDNHFPLSSQPFLS